MNFPTTPFPPLIPKEQVDLETEREKARLTRLSHAITLLNNHLSWYGGRANPQSGDHEHWKQGEEAAYLLGPVPPDLLPHMNAAIVNAAKLVAAEFASEGVSSC